METAHFRQYVLCNQIAIFFKPTARPQVLAHLYLPDLFTLNWFGLLRMKGAKIKFTVVLKGINCSVVDSCLLLLFLL